MPEVHYIDCVTEQLRADVHRLERELEDVRDRLAFAEARLRDEFNEKMKLVGTSNRLRNELTDAKNRLERLRAGGKA